MRSIWRGLRAVLLGLTALWFFFEEFGWRPLTAWLGRLNRWAPWARLEARVARLPPRPGLCLFLVPVVLLLPVKVMALHLIEAGQPMLGLVVIVIAKLLGTAIGGRLFVLMRRQLMTLKSFARTMAWWRRTRWRVRRALNAWPAWQAMRRRFRQWRITWRRRLR